MATVEEVRENQEAWQDKEVVITVKTGDKYEGKLNPSMGGFYLGNRYLDEIEIVNIALKGKRTG